MQVQTLYMPWDSFHGVLAIRAQLIAKNNVLVDDFILPKQFLNNLNVFNAAGYYTDPVQAKNHKEYFMDGNHITLYQNHGKTVGYWEAWVEADGLVMIQYARSLDGKPVLKQYQAFAKNEGKANATTPYEQGVLEIQSKARLKKDKGYVDYIEDAMAPSTNSLGLLKPMLATPLEKVKPQDIEWDGAFVQPKLDGHRALFKDGVLYSRQGKVLELPHIVETIKAAGMEDFHLDGELYIHGKSLQEMSKLIKKHRPESLDIEYHIYDQILDEPFLTRICRLGNSVSHWPASSPLKAVPTHKVESMEQLMEFHAHYREAGYEGTMIRFGKEHYRDGKRSRTLLKMKEFQDEEFCIVGVRKGKPYVTDKGTFQVPVWVCCLKDDASKTFTVTAAGTMQEKHDQWVNQDDHLYKFLTVKFHYYSSDGIPQLPIALRFQELV